MPNGSRTDCAAGVVGNKIYVIGGYNREYDSTPGMDFSMSSTIVYDTTTEKWEPKPSAHAVPDMKKGRFNFLVVVVDDRFVVAMGGIGSKGDNWETIDVLDTERNTWYPAKSPGHSDYIMGGFLKETREMIVVRGCVYPKSEYYTQSIAFEKIKPTDRVAQERGQKIVGDVPHGEDQLGVKIMAEALADTLVYKDLNPPFVIGVFGKWGLGKSFFFDLMLQHIINIQKIPASDTLFKETYAGHIYVVNFSAWEFAKGDIFSSLMYKILKDLNEQLQFEADMDDIDLFQGNVSTVEVFRKYSQGDINFLKSNEKVWESFRNIEKKGDQASDCLMKAININYEKDLREIEFLDAQIRIEENNNKKRHFLKFLGHFGVEALKTALDNQKIELKAYEEELEKLEKELEDNENGEKKEELEKLKKNIEGIKSIDSLIDDLDFFCEFKFSNIPYFALIIFVVSIIIVIIVWQLQSQDIIESDSIAKWVSLPLPVLSLLKGGSLAVRKFREEVEDATAYFEKFDFDSNELKKLEAKKSEVQNRTREATGFSLKETIEKIDNEKYKKNLSIVHTVQEDLKRMTESMLNPRCENIFPRGKPRIVLIVDDLDRCGHHIVVEVIEALQLIVGTELFVAVLAIDPMYVTNCLEKHYKEVLYHNHPPTGMDYLEKIVQIPFRLPRIEQHNVAGYIDSQIFEKDKLSILYDVDVNGVVDGNGDGDGDGRVDSSGAGAGEAVVDSGKGGDAVGDGKTKNDEEKKEGTTKTESENEKETTKSGAGTASDLPKATAKLHEAISTLRRPIPFDTNEINMMQEVFVLFGVEPRCMKRIINVFKLLKVIWARDDKTLKVGDNLKKATLFMMLLASDKSTRDVTYIIFDWMESRVVQYHHVESNNLADLFKKELQKDKRFKLSSSNKPYKEGTFMYHIDLYLAEYEWENLDGWNTVSKKFMLARCFSFFRLVTNEIDNKKQVLDFNIKIPRRDQGPTLYRSHLGYGT